MLQTTAARVRRDTPAARALVGCVALSDGATLNEAARLAGYRLDLASPVMFYRGTCRRRGENVRVVVRNGHIVRVSRSAWELTGWLLRLGKKLSFFGLRARSAA